jgi:glycerophosphoryl diester phosphodiesterase
MLKIDIKKWFTRLAAAGVLIGSLIPFRGDFSPRQGVGNYGNQIVAAHRAGSDLYHENSLEAIKYLSQKNVGYAELDVRESKDKNLVVYHNRTLDSQPISRLTLKEIQGKAKQKGYTIPTLSESLAELQKQGKGIIADVKAGEMSKVYLAIRDYLPDSQIVMSSKSASQIKDFKSQNPGVKTTLVMGTGLQHPADEARQRLGIVPWREIKESGTDYISVREAGLNSSFLEHARQGNVGVLVWGTKDKESEDKTLAEKSVVGVITDNPSIAKQKNGLEHKVLPALILISFIISGLLLFPRYIGFSILENYQTTNNLGIFLLLFGFILCLIYIIKKTNK